jgi:hypothetical protein
VSDIDDFCAPRPPACDVLYVDPSILIDPVHNDLAAVNKERVHLGTAVVSGHENLIARLQSPDLTKLPDGDPAQKRG